MISVRTVLVVARRRLHRLPRRARARVDGAGRRTRSSIVIALGLYLATTWLCIFWDPREAPRPADDEHPPPIGVRGPDDAARVGVRPRARLRRPRAEQHRCRRGRRLADRAVRHLVPRRDRRAHDDRHGPPPPVGGLGGHRRARRRLDGVDGPGRRAAARPRRIDRLGRRRAAAAASRSTARRATPRGWRSCSARHPRGRPRRSVRQRERRVQVQRALAVAGPILSRTVATGGRLDDEDQARGARRRGSAPRRDARPAPARRRRPRAARGARGAAGATVTVLDEGGLDGLDAASLALIRAQLAETLRTSQSDRLYIRTSPDERVAVTVVGRSAAGLGPRRRGCRRALARDRASRLIRLAAGRSLGEPNASSPPVPVGEGNRGGERNRKWRGAAERLPPAVRTVTRKPSAWPNLRLLGTVRSAERQSVPAVQVSRGASSPSVGISGDKSDDSADSVRDESASGSAAEAAPADLAAKRVAEARAG